MNFKGFAMTIIKKPTVLILKYGRGGHNTLYNEYFSGDVILYKLKMQSTSKIKICLRNMLHGVFIYLGQVSAVE